MGKSSKLITELDSAEVRQRLLKSASYFDMELPDYFDFEPLLEHALDRVSNLSYKEFIAWKPEEFQGLNYTLMSNKDGSIAWRPFELINPLIYAKCVKLLTCDNNWNKVKNRFNEFAGGYVECCSISVISEEKSSKKEQILNWWKTVEQRSLELSLEFSHCKITDVSNCYPSIYSHAIGWAIHDRDFMKEKKNRSNNQLLGNQLDKLIRSSREGQTNGIPQASLLSHILAELVLGYCDLGINKRISERGKDFKDVKILRYRDDYRIFGHSDSDCNSVLKIISEELIEFGMRLGAAKTSDEQNIVVGAVKKDKIRALGLPLRHRTLQKRLLVYHDFSMKNPGAGALKFLLSEFIDVLENCNVPRMLERENIKPEVLVAILMDIGASSPNVFPAVATSVSMIMNALGQNQKDYIFNLVRKRTSRIPNNGYMEIWLQRIAVPNKIKFQSNERMCEIFVEPKDSLWNFDWVAKADIRDSLNNYSIVDGGKIDKLKPFIERWEFDAFWNEYY